MLSKMPRSRSETNCFESPGQLVRLNVLRNRTSQRTNSTTLAKSSNRLGSLCQVFLCLMGCPPKWNPMLPFTERSSIFLSLLPFLSCPQLQPPQSTSDLLLPPSYAQTMQRVVNIRKDANTWSCPPIKHDAPHQPDQTRQFTSCWRLLFASVQFHYFEVSYTAGPHW